MRQVEALLFLMVLIAVVGCMEKVSSISAASNRPNFLLVVTDDQSWVHTSFAGDPAVKTPSFDAIARNGIYFERAYAAAPTCTASRSALFSGQSMWRTGAGAVLWGSYPRNLLSFQALLEQHGYLVGYTGKGWGPGRNLGALPNPAGHSFQHYGEKHPASISNIDYLQSFVDFIHHLRPGQPFSFVFTPTEPHRPYPARAAEDRGIDADVVVVPDFLPPTRAVKEDIANYLSAIEYQDQILGEIIEFLQQENLLDNTVVVVTSDNGMPFPRAKSNLYEYGVRVPLALQWPAKIAGGQRRAGPVSLTDLAPTFLDLAGIPIPSAMTGRSLRALFDTGNTANESVAFTGFERHIANARLGDQSYPMRAVHTERYAYIRNFRPELWPAGDPPHFDDIDGDSPTKAQMLSPAANQTMRKLLSFATQKRPLEELYDLQNDPNELNNLASDPKQATQLARLKKLLLVELQRTDDPILREGPAFFSSFR